MAKAKPAPAPPERLEREIPIQWEVPPEVITRHVTHFVVQNTGQELLLSFFEIRPPLIVGTPEQQRAQAEQIDTVAAECVGRIVVATGRIPELIELLQANLNNLAKARAGGE